MPFRLARADQDMLHAELRGADFGIYLAVRLRPEVLADAEAALATTLHAWPSLLARVARAGAEFVMVPDAPERIDAGTLASLASTEPLAERTILAARGGRLLRYRLDVDAGRLELLTHHLVLDADSLADLDLALAGAALPATTEWPWGQAEDRDLVMPTADQPLVPTSLPAPGTTVGGRCPRPTPSASKRRQNPVVPRPSRSSGRPVPGSARAISVLS